MHLGYVIYMLYVDDAGTLSQKENPKVLKSNKHSHKHTMSMQHSQDTLDRIFEVR